MMEGMTMSAMTSATPRRETARTAPLDRSPKLARGATKAISAMLLSREELKAEVASCVD